MPVHPGALFVHSPNFTTADLPGGHIPEEIAPEGDRTSVRLFLTVTDQYGLSGKDWVQLVPSNWESLFGNEPPLVTFSYSGYQPYQVIHSMNGIHSPLR